MRDREGAFRRVICNKLSQKLHYIRSKCGCVVCSQVQRLYGKYLRAESFRKALIYQKKYLLLLIGGFRDCEEETLAMIARMGAQPSPGDLAYKRLSPLSKFRSAARVIIAISRFLSFLTEFGFSGYKKMLITHFVLHVQVV